MFILTGATGDVIFRSIVTLALLAAFAFATIGENYASLVRDAWVTLVRIFLLLLTLGAGIWHIWAPTDLDGMGSNYNVNAGEFLGRTFLFILTVGALQLAALGFSILESRIRAKRVSGGFLAVLGAGISAFALAMLMVALGFTFPERFFDSSMEGYWRAMAAIAVASVILIIIPVMGRALNPDNRPKQVTQAYVPAQEPYPPSADQVSYSPVKVIPAGWYPTQDAALERFWDGEKWTSYTRPAGVDDELPPMTEGKID